MTTKKNAAKIAREIKAELLGGKLGPAIQACVRIGMDTTASELTYCVQNAIGPQVPAETVRRTIASAWPHLRPRRSNSR
jgi:hypothetical protein